MKSVGSNTKVIQRINKCFAKDLSESLARYFTLKRIVYNKFCDSRYTLNKIREYSLNNINSLDFLYLTYT